MLELLNTLPALNPLQAVGWGILLGVILSPLAWWAGKRNKTKAAPSRPVEAPLKRPSVVAAKVRAKVAPRSFEEAAKATVEKAKASCRNRRDQVAYWMQAMKAEFGTEPRQIDCAVAFGLTQGRISQLMH